MLGNKLKQLRLAKHMTLEQLANSLNSKYPQTVNFNKGKLSKWENNREEPKLSSVRLLADFYGLTIDDLYQLEIDDMSIISIYSELNDINKQLTYEFAKKKLNEQNSLLDR